MINWDGYNFSEKEVNDWMANVRELVELVKAGGGGGGTINAAQLLALINNTATITAALNGAGDKVELTAIASTPTMVTHFDNAQISGQLNPSAIASLVPAVGNSAILLLDTAQTSGPTVNANVVVTRIASSTLGFWAFDGTNTWTAQDTIVSTSILSGWTVVTYVSTHFSNTRGSGQLIPAMFSSDLSVVGNSMIVVNQVPQASGPGPASTIIITRTNTDQYKFLAYDGTNIWSATQAGADPIITWTAQRLPDPPPSTTDGKTYAWCVYNGTYSWQEVV